MGVIAGSDRGSTHNGCAVVYIGDFSWQRVDKAGGARRMRLGGREFLANHGRTGPVRPTFCLRRAFVNGLDGSPTASLTGRGSSFPHTTRRVCYDERARNGITHGHSVTDHDSVTL